MAQVKGMVVVASVRHLSERVGASAPAAALRAMPDEARCVLEDDALCRFEGTWD